MGKTYKDSSRENVNKLRQRNFDRKFLECLDDGNFRKLKKFKNKKGDYEQQDYD